MRYILTLTWIAVIVLFLGCSSKSSTGPDDDEGTVIARQSIGPEGGSVGTSDFQLSIPENAFSETVNLSLSLSSMNPPFEDNTVCRIYELLGLPESFSEPLKIKIKYSGNLSDQTFLAVGREYAVPDTDATVILYNYYEGQDSSGFILAEIHSNNTALFNKCTPSRPNEDIKYFVTLFSGFAEIEISSLSTVTGPSEKTAVLKEKTESVINRIQQFASSFPAYEYRIHIYIQPSSPFKEWRIFEGVRRIDSDMRAGYAIEIHHSVICVDATRIAQEEVIPQLGRCFFQFLVQKDFAPPSYVNVVTGKVQNSRNIWLHTAIAAWSEIFFADNENYVPSHFLINMDAPFYQSGLSFDIEDYSDHLDFGYGMSALIKFLVDTHPDKAGMILNLYHQLEISAPECHLTALIDQQNKPVNEWWPDFIESYLTGQVFDFTIPKLIEPEPVDWTVDDKNDTEWSLKKDYPDICCDLIRFSFDFNAISDKADLTLGIMNAQIASDLSGLSVFVYDGNTLNLLGKADVRDLVIGNIKGLCTDQRDLVLALTKSAYQTPNLDGEEQIDVYARIDSTAWFTPVCQLDCYLWSNVHWESKLENGPPPEDIDFYVGVWAEADEATSSWEGMQFSATWDYDNELSPEIHYHGNMMIEYDPENDAIAYFQCNQQMTQQTADGLETSTWSIAGQNLPHTPHNTDDYILYSVEGSAAHQAVTHLMYTFDGVDTYQSLNSGPLQNSENRIEIKFLTQ
jgi:hypothetical protein